MSKPTYKTLLKHLKIMASGIGDELAASGPEEVATNPYLVGKAKELAAALRVIKRAEGKE